MATIGGNRAVHLIATLSLGGVLVAGGSAAAAPVDRGRLPAAVPDRPAPTAPLFLAANLRGKNEVPQGVGDPDGSGRAAVRIRDGRVCFAISWTGIAAPTAAHIHEGRAGVNGPVVVDLLGALPATLRAVAGCVKAEDPTIEAIKSDPGAFYVNLHTAEFPGGAVRGQLHLSNTALDLLGELRGPLLALADGAQEAPLPGDADGRATGFVRADRDRVGFAVTWSAIGPPTAGHIHAGRVGQAGAVVVDLLRATAPLPASLFAVAGEVGGVSAETVKSINLTPGSFYLNLHNAEFPAGAVRGQLFRADSAGGAAATFTAAVRSGVQIYACTAQSDGTFRFVQHDVRAVLEGNIAHSFVTKRTGPPQWVAADGSAVTGRVVARTPNGAGTIDELELEATQTGPTTGRLARTVEILRLNTVGGVAPAGTCDPYRQPVVEVPYRADYMFVAG